MSWGDGVPAYSDELAVIISQRNARIEAMTHKIERLVRAWDRVRDTGALIEVDARTSKQSDAVWEMDLAIGKAFE